MKGLKIDRPNIRKLMGVLNHPREVYLPVTLFQVNDFVSQEKYLESYLLNQGIEKEYLTISNMEQVKDFLQNKYDRKRFVNFDEDLIKPKIIKHDFYEEKIVREANKVRDSLRHTGTPVKTYTIDMIKGDAETIDLKTVCDFHIKEIDRLMGNKNLGKMKESMRERYNHSGVPQVKTNDFLEISGYVHSPSEAIEEIRRLEQMKSDFERAIKQFPRSISLKDSYTRYRMFSEEIIKSLRGNVKKTDFINDLVDIDSKKIKEMEEEAEFLRKKLGRPSKKHDFVDSTLKPESPRKKLTNAQKKLVEAIHGKGDFYEVEDELFFKPKDKDATFRVDFDI